MSKESIVAKALKCIDEIYPSENTLNETFYPTETFIDEMVRWVIDVAPIHELITREDIIVVAPIIKDGVAQITQTDDWGRVIYVKCKDWVRPADIINEDDILYRQQTNKTLRGNPLRPIAVRTIGGLKLYTTTISLAADIELMHVPYDAEYIPSRLEDIASWKLAEIVLMSMHDTQSASVCSARVNELLQMLQL